MTDEQAGAWRQIRGLAAPSRYRVVADREGYPVIRGRYGDIEWFHVEGIQLAAYTAGSRQRLGRLLSLPGIIRHQIGDSEARVLFPVEQFEVMATVLGSRRRKQVSPEHVAALRAGLARHARQSPSTGSDLAPRAHERP